MPENLTMSSLVTTEQGYRIFVNKMGKRVRLPVEARLTGGEGTAHWLNKGLELADEDLHQQAGRPGTLAG